MSAILSNISAVVNAPVSKLLDVEDTANSSILEFLSAEQRCLDDNSEVDIESLFEEINRLSGDVEPNRNGEDIDMLIKEAEMLMTKQDVGRMDFSMTETKSKVLGSILSKESTPREMKSGGDLDCVESQKIADTTTAASKLQLSTRLMESSDDDADSDTLNNDKSPLNTSVYYDAESSRKSSFTANRRTSIDYSLNSTLNRRRSPDINTARSRESPIQRQNSPCLRESRRSPCLTPPPNTNRFDRHFVNKCTSPSPPRSMISMSTSTSFCRERNLESEIEVLQEKLKDTEERLQSLRLQYDSLTQTHRTLRDSQNHSSEESERLKIDVQHLNDCTQRLKAELQTARNDRAEALELQKVLQKELDESRADKKKIADQGDKDAKTIQDLHRQCKEMERILIRKHPDSVSALIVASKNPSCTDDKSASRRLLEQRIAQLEADAKDQDVKAQKILANVQSRFNSVQSKYEQHIGDLETQVLSLQEINAQLNETIMEQTETMKSNQQKVLTINQTFDVPERDTVEKFSTACQTDFKFPSTNTPAKSLPIKKSKSSSDSLQMNGKDDPNLMATLRGMRIDLAIKEKAVLRLTRELDECKKTIKKLQREKESNKPAASTSKKVGDGSQPTEADVNALKDSQNRIKMLEYDYGILHNKRLNDLKTLQSAHERELAQCQETIRLLQQRLAERDEAFAMQKRRKVPIDYFALKAKVTSLERRHTEREQRLHMLVEMLSKGRLNGSLDALVNMESKES
ncbi:centrosomal protein of 162 kDa [Bradysia coprophila]|uniref:centrosomal protein of 162 kDa n=1 Tax=Bradysia coprophila TaxID=38358 RepID=UPI00187D90A4|nr:centrosomal protein of 162 kDa [Bradysia coprophila]